MRSSPDDSSPNSSYAVIFTSRRNDRDEDGYARMAAAMERLAGQQPGFLGIESARDAQGLGITVSYWESLEAVEAWRRNAEHLVAQGLGRSAWYEQYAIRVCRVEWETRWSHGEGP
ncbi:MAG: antibiotic biosynthesis monooxygenase [Pirellulales bacterium]